VSGRGALIDQEHGPHVRYSQQLVQALQLPTLERPGVAQNPEIDLQSALITILRGKCSGQRWRISRKIQCGNRAASKPRETLDLPEGDADVDIEYPSL
jgi:hypothetical protein